MLLHQLDSLLELSGATGCCVAQSFTAVTLLRGSETCSDGARSGWFVESRFLVFPFTFESLLAAVLYASVRWPREVKVGQGLRKHAAKCEGRRALFSDNSGCARDRRMKP